MSDSAFNADLDALVRGEAIASDDELTRFVSDLYGEEQNMTMPNALKLSIANDLGLAAADDHATISAPVSRRTMRASAPHRQSSRPWAIALTIAAAVLLALTGILRWGMPTTNDESDNRFLFSSPAIPTVAATPSASPEASAGAEQDWMRPIDADECVDDGGELPDASIEDLDSLPQREYVIVGPANEADAVAANEVVRQYISCENPVSFLSEQYAIEASLAGVQFSPALLVLMDRQLEDGISISQQLAEQGITLDDVVLTGDPGSDGYFVPNPTRTYVLEDGRIVVTFATVTGSSYFGQIWSGTVIVLTNEDDVWKIDDVPPICIGDCESVFRQYESLWKGFVWLQPIANEECELNANIPNGLTPAEVAAVRSRQYRACEQGGTAQSLQSSDYRVTEGQAAKPLSDEISTLYRQNGEMPGSLQRIANQQVEDTVPTFEFPSEPWTTFQPGSVVELSDGRVAVIEASVVTPEIVAGTTGRTSPFVTTALVWAVDGDSWLVDEEVTVCMGVCDSFWGDEPVATPESTPVAIVIPETCESGDDFVVDFTSHDRMVTIVRPGPGTGIQIGVLGFGTPLQYLCEAKETTNPTVDRMDAGQHWLLVRTEDGIEGWVREVDLREYEP